MLRTPQLKPYIIYIKPPTFDVMKETRAVAYARSTFDENNSRGFTVGLSGVHSSFSSNEQQALFDMSSFIPG